MNFYQFSPLDIGPNDLDQTRSTDWASSHFWKRKTSKEMLDTPSKVVTQFLETLSSLCAGDKSAETKEALKLALSVLQKALQHQRYASDLLMEHVFEEVRRTQFSGFPSRLSCMFLFDKEIEPIAYAGTMGLNPKEYNLVEVEIDPRKANWARVNTVYLTRGLDYYDVMVSNAHNYWQHVPDIDLDTEVLFAGNFHYSQIVMPRTEPTRFHHHDPGKDYVSPQ